MGLQSIMNAKKIVLIALGKSKVEAVNKLVHGEIDIEWPCTILKNHPDVTIYVDSDLMVAAL